MHKTFIFQFMAKFHGLSYLTTVRSLVLKTKPASLIQSLHYHTLCS